MDRTIRKDFPELGDDVFVEIKNPRLASAARLNTPRNARVDKDGNLDQEDQRQIGAEMFSWFVLRWCVYPTPTDEQWSSGDFPTEPLGPPSVETFLRLPSEVELWIVDTVLGARRPS